MNVDIKVCRQRKRFQEALRVTRAVVDYCVKKAMKAREERMKQSTKRDNGHYNFLSELLEYTEDTELIRDQAMNILFASRETTASLLGFVVGVIK
jgi:cytochrome P450